MNLESNTKWLLSVRMEKCKQAPTFLSRNGGLCTDQVKICPMAPCLGGLGSVSCTAWPEKRRVLGGLPYQIATQKELPWVVLQFGH